MAKTTSKYKETKSWFRLRGIIRGKDEPRRGFGFTEAIGKNGNQYRSLRFNIETSANNQVVVELFGSVQKFAYHYNKATRESKKVAWNQRTQKINGFDLIVPDYDAVAKYNEEFHDGDSVVCVGEIRYSTYHNPKTDKDSLQNNLVIKQLYQADEPINFDDPNFKEESVFQQDIIVSDVSEVDGKLNVLAYTISYGDKFDQAQFVVNSNNVGERFYNTMKRLKFGTQLKVDGVINNRAVVAEQDEDSEWGVHVTHVRARDRSLEIRSVFEDTVIPKAYSENEILKAVAETKNRVQEHDKNFNPDRLENNSTSSNKYASTGNTGYTETKESESELPFNL